MLTYRKVITRYVFHARSVIFNTQNWFGNLSKGKIYATFIVWCYNRAYQGTLFAGVMSWREQKNWHQHKKNAYCRPKTNLNRKSKCGQYHADWPMPCRLPTDEVSKKWPVLLKINAPRSDQHCYTDRTHGQNKPSPVAPREKTLSSIHGGNYVHLWHILKLFF